MITQILTIFLLMWIKVQCGDSIPELTPYKSNITKQIGSILKIDCPITAQNGESGSNGLMFSWSVKDVDENMVATDPRYSFINGSRTAIIKNVKPADSGVYKCRGVTGFGSQEATFYVNIIEHQACVAAESSLNQVPRRPCFLDSTMQNSQNKVLTIHRNVGSSVEFRCDSGGNPKPNYVWFMGKSVASWIRTVEDVRQPILSIKNLQREYTGHYTCRVSNTHGKISFTFALVVKESPEGLPKIKDEMQNVSAVIGSSAELTGSISCKCNPIIQWLQRDDKQPIPNKSRRNIIALPQASTSESGEIYVTLDNDSDIPSDDSVNVETIRQTSGLITSKLKFLNLKSWHSGKYVLLTMSRQKASVHEISYKTVFLEVLPDKSLSLTDKTNSPPKIIVYIAVPLGILILCIFVVFYCFVRRKNLSNGHLIVGEQSMKSKRSVSSNNHSMSIGGIDTASKACLKHGPIGTPAVMTLTSSINSNAQYNPSRLNSNHAGTSPYLLQGHIGSGPTLVPAPSSNSSTSHPNSCHKINNMSNNSSSNDSAGLVKQNMAPPSNSPYSYSSNPPYPYYHQYNRNSVTVDYQQSASIPSNNASIIGNNARESSSNGSDFSVPMKQKLNHSNQSLNNGNVLRNIPTTHNSITNDCHCPNQYFIPDLMVAQDSIEQSFQLPPSLCFDNNSSYPSNQYHSTAAYFPGHNSSSSASLTYS